MQPAVAVDGRPVERRAQRALAGHHPDQPAAAHHRRGAEALVGQPIEDRPRAAVRLRCRPGRVDITLCSWVKRSKPAASCLGEDAHGLVALVDHHHRAVGALVDEVERLLHRVGAAQRDRRLVDRVARLHVLDVVARRCRAGCPGAAPRCPPRRATVSAMRRPATAVMFDDHDRMVVPEPSGVVRSTSSREPPRQAGHHEHVAVREVVRGLAVVEEAHGCERLRAPAALAPPVPNSPLRMNSDVSRSFSSFEDEKERSADAVEDRVAGFGGFGSDRECAVEGGRQGRETVGVVGVQHEERLTLLYGVTDGGRPAHTRGRRHRVFFAGPSHAETPAATPTASASSRGQIARAGRRSRPAPRRPAREARTSADPLGGDHVPPHR